ncbi:MAG: zinc-dependent alcohol dehydrogenase family protein [Alphaproteobacteria bacterium]
MPSKTRAVQFARFGEPTEVAEVVVEEVREPGPGEVTIDIEAAAINPSHLLTLQGKYGVAFKLPAVPGSEGAGTIAAAGPDVARFKVGDRVLVPAYAGTWRQRVTVQAADILAGFPREADPVQCSMLLANPPTAYLMLTRYVDLKPGDWVIQNAANSAVGQYLIQLCRHYGWRTVNVVRRTGMEDFFARLGGDATVVDGPDLAARVQAATGSAPVRLAIDAVAGAATARLAACVEKHGTVVNYGLLSGEPCHMPPEQTVFRNVSLRGFWLTMWLREYSTQHDREQVYALLRDLIVRGVLHADVEATYPISRAKEALAHAARGGRMGKIVFAPQSEALP